jgi:hypothetical protein
MCAETKYLMQHQKRRIGNLFCYEVAFVSKSHALNTCAKDEGKRINGKKYAIIAKINIFMMHI